MRVDTTCIRGLENKPIYVESVLLCEGCILFGKCMVCGCMMICGECMCMVLCRVICV